jgi:hypothetical protein
MNSGPVTIPAQHDKHIIKDQFSFRPLICYNFGIPGTTNTGKTEFHLNVQNMSTSTSLVQNISLKRIALNRWGESKRQCVNMFIGGGVSLRHTFCMLTRDLELDLQKEFHKPRAIAILQ